MSSTLAQFAPRSLTSTHFSGVTDPGRVARARASQARAMAVPPALRVPLGDAGAHHEALVIEPALRPQGGVSLQFENRSDTARMPAQTQVRYRCTLGRDALLRLREAIDAVLDAQAQAAGATSARR